MITRFDCRQQGSALVMSLLTGFTLFGIAGAYLLLSIGGWESSNRELAVIEARLAGEDGIQLSIAELRTGIDTGGDGLGNVTTTITNGTNVTVTAMNIGGNVYRLHSVGVLDRARHGADVVVERVPTGVVNFTARAAITAQGPVTTLGNIVVDGRNWNSTGTALIGPGKYGISSMGAIMNSGNSKVGGNGIPPAKPPPAGTQQPNADWSDGINQDGDGFIDEEAFDGIDNDGDGLIDEDTFDYPSGPDVMLHIPVGTLKGAAITYGTYFTSQAQYDACIAANGGKVPGGKVLYCDFDLFEPVDLGSSFNSPPSIIVHHNPTGTAMMRNLHGMFAGLLMADFVEHINGDFVIVGAVMSFSNQAFGNAFGNGNAFIKLSTQVLAQLPTAGGPSNVRIKAWNRAVAQ